MGLLSPSDVIFYSKVDKDFPTCDVEDINDVEWKEFSDILGYDFYTELAADLVDLDAIEPWKDLVQYNDGDKVYYDSGTGILDLTEGYYQLEDGEWKPIEKFESDCNNELWCNGLARYLALSVICQTILPASTPLTGLGVVEKSSDYTRSASTSRVKALEQHYYERRSIALQRLDHFVSKSKCCFDKYKNKHDTMSCGCKVSCGCGCGAGSGNSAAGWIFGVEEDCNTHTDRIYVGAVKQVPSMSFSNIRGYKSRELGDASGDQIYYLIKNNIDGADERMLVFNTRMPNKLWSQFQNLNGYKTYEEGDASGDQIYYLTIKNKEGADERMLVYNDKVNTSC